MLDGWLKVAYEQQRRETWTGELSELLKQLPVEELRKIASGVTIKQAYGDCMPEERQSFLDKFKGSPLIEQAIALEQEEIQADMLDMQKRQERRMEQKSEDNVWDMKDQIRLKRRLLELQLAKEQSGAAGATPIPGETAQGAGAPGDIPAEGVQDNSQGLMGKTSSVKTVELTKEKFAFADQMGRILAREEAHQFELQKIAAAAGALMAKEALPSLGAVGGLASKALGLAVKHPALAGAAVGAAGGALAGGPGNRLGGALGGAAAGGALGHAAGGIGKSMAGGKGFLESAKGYGQGLLGQAKGLVGAPQPQPQAM